nr:hypothetical protein [Tanacetum cinerariifolium]
KNLFDVLMESLSPEVVSAAKLPILNPNEFNLWKMRIEQYFLMTDYSPWEIILNGDSPAPTKTDADDLEEMDLKWQMTMLTKRNPPTMLLWPLLLQVFLLTMR